MMSRNPLALLLLLTLFSTTTAAVVLPDFWSKHGVSLLAEESQNFFLLKTQTGQEFYLKDIESTVPLQSQRLLDLITLFYGWQQIKISRLQFVTNAGTIRVVLIPAAVEFQQKEYLPHIPSGILFSDDGEQLSYNFRVVNNALFLRIQGSYLNEEELLQNIADAISAGEKHIAEQDPNYLIQKIKDLSQEIILLRRTLISLNEPAFCISEICRDGPFNETLFSANRYPPQRIKSAKQQLNSLDYRIDNLDGIWDYQTFRAITTFQERTPLLMVNGELNEMTSLVLANSPLHNINPEANDPLNLKNTFFLNPLQAKGLRLKIKIALYNQQLDPGEIDTQWNIKSHQAYIQYQRKNSLPIDGLWSREMAEHLFKQPFDTLTQLLTSNEVFPVEWTTEIQNTLEIKGYLITHNVQPI